MYVDFFWDRDNQTDWLGALMLEADGISTFGATPQGERVLQNVLKKKLLGLSDGLYGRLTQADRDDFLRALPDYYTQSIWAVVQEDDQEQPMPKTKPTIADTLLEALKAKLDAEGSTAVCVATRVALPIIWRFVHGESGLSLTTAAKLADYLDLELRPRQK
jgi:hypothetical protein